VKAAGAAGVEATGGCDWWLAAVAGRWVVAFLDLLD